MGKRIPFQPTCMRSHVALAPLVAWLASLLLVSCGKGPELAGATLRMYMEAASAYESGDMETASMLARRLAKEYPDFSPAVLLWAKTLYLAGDARSAAVALEGIPERGARPRDVELWLARAYRGVEEPEAATLCLERLLENSPGDCAALRLRAALALDGGEPALARAYLDRAIEEGFELALACMDRAELSWLAGNAKAALEDIDRALYILPPDTSMASAARSLRKSVSLAFGGGTNE